MYLIVKHKGNPILSIPDSSISELDLHIQNGYPELLDDYISGNITGEESATVPVLVQYPATEHRILEKLLKAKPFLAYIFELENRVRALEGFPSITRDAFITAVKDRLGL